ncbi:META domain-containing protein [Streptomyces sp. NPDC055055]
MPKTRALVVLVPLLLLPACGTEGGAGSGSGADTVRPDVPVAGTSWTVDAVTVDGRRSAAPDGARLDFGKDGRARGNTGCNTFGAAVVVRGGGVTVTPQEVTEMGCAADRQRFEQELLKALSGRLEATTKDDTLRLESSDGRKGLELTAEPPAELRGTTWKIDGLVSGTSTASLPAGGEGKARLVLGADGRMSGNLGCNNFSAKARVDDRTLTVEGPAATTRMMCTGPQMELETKLYALLDGPLTYRLNHRTLTLTDASGEGFTATAATS